MVKEDLSAVVRRLRAMGTDDERVEVKSSADQLPNLRMFGSQ